MPISESRNAIAAELRLRTPAGTDEALHVARLQAFLETEPYPFDRSTVSGHVTASAFIVDVSRRRALLIWHEKLQRWLQPGGHCEADDVSPHAAAMREALEETGLPPAALRVIADTIFDVDAHWIPDRAGESGHWHYDIRYLLEAEEAGDAARWVPLKDLMASGDQSLSRMASRIVHAL